MFICTEENEMFSGNRPRKSDETGKYRVCFFALLAVALPIFIVLSSSAVCQTHKPTGTPQSAPSTWTDSSEMLSHTGQFHGVCLGHINGDGNLDFAGANESGVQTYFGDGTGRWTKTPETPVLTGRYNYVILADYDGNGKTDLFACGESTGVRLWTGDGTGRWTDVTSAVNLPIAGGNWAAVSTGDVNNDLRTDLIATNYFNGVKCFIQDASGLFSEQSIGLPTDQRDGSVCIADFNKDGKPDLAVSGGSTAAAIYYGNGGEGGVMNWIPGASVGLPSSGFNGLSAGDLNKDGFPDLVAGGYESGAGIKVFLNDGGTGWTESSSGLPSTGKFLEARLADFDKDGKIDLACPSFGGTPKGIKVFYGNGGSAWAESSIGLPSHMAVGIDVGDFNNDGLQDIIEGAAAPGGATGIYAFINSNVSVPEHQLFWITYLLCTFSVIYISIIYIYKRHKDTTQRHNALKRMPSAYTRVPQNHKKTLPDKLLC